MDVFKRPASPVIDPAWTLIEEEARRVLLTNLSARRVVDVSGPHGWDYSAVNLGRLDPALGESGEVRYGIRKVLPLVEIRMPFYLRTWELDDVSRGAADPDLAPLAQAARAVAMFEERAVYDGFDPGHIAGLTRAGGHAPIPLDKDPARLPERVAQGLLVLTEAGVEGPYALVLGPAAYKAVVGTVAPYPLRKQIETLIGGHVVMSPALEGGFLVSRRGGDLELTLGQDLTIGYEGHDERQVRLYLTETFTFRVLDATSVVELRATK